MDADIRDDQVRVRAFEFLTRQTQLLGEVLPWAVLSRGFDFEGQRVPLIGPRGSSSRPCFPRYLSPSRRHPRSRAAGGLALMKVARGEAHDLAGIEDVHRASPLSLDTLVERYGESRVEFIGNPADLRLGFLALVARLFGEGEAQRLEKKLR